MKTKEYRTVDKSTWGRGPWDNEPDKKQWQDKATGLPCLIHRGPSGSLCGYVGVAKGHPAFEKGYENVNVEVHGGLTYADFCQPVKDEAHGICHIPDAGEPDHVWWLGFDCAHLGDVSPAHDHKFSAIHGDTYKRFRYVEDEVRSLARQLAEQA